MNRVHLHKSRPQKIGQSKIYINWTVNVLQITKYFIFAQPKK